MAQPAKRFRSRLEFDRYVEENSLEVVLLNWGAMGIRKGESYARAFWVNEEKVKGK